jgi:hypothetical protein
MIVLIAGMPRSGSTFSFNVARDVLRIRGTLYQEPCEDVLGAVQRSRGAQHVLVKAHALDESSLVLAKAGAFKVIITVRRIEDAVASWLETFDALPEVILIAIMHQWLRMFLELWSVALVVPYDELDRKPLLAVRRIARHICPAVGWRETFRIGRHWAKARVKQQADLIVPGTGVQDLGWSYYDKETFLHRRHVSDVTSREAEEQVAPERLARIRTTLMRDLAAAGLS